MFLRYSRYNCKTEPARFGAAGPSPEPSGFPA